MGLSVKEKYRSFKGKTLMDKCALASIFVLFLLVAFMLMMIVEDEYGNGIDSVVASNPAMHEPGGHISKAFLRRQAAHLEEMTDMALDAEAMDAEQKVGLIMCSRSFFLNKGSLNDSERLLERGHASSLI